MKNVVFAFVIVVLVLSGTSVLMAGMTTINGNVFDLDQFNGATVTYRVGGSVDFDGKLWDNAVGVDLYTLGELASGQYGSDPGDQVTLQDRTNPDWLQLNYANPLLISASQHRLVIYEITSATSGVDTEGLSFNISLNGGSLIGAGSSVATFYAHPGVEATNQLVFDLYDFGFSNGDLLSTLYIENTDSGSGTSDPDFIFAGMATDAAAVPVPSAFLLGSIGVSFIGYLRKRERN